VFKKLRKEGKIEKLINTTNRLYDKIYSQWKIRKILF
jgi:hypothetical protein